MRSDLISRNVARLVEVPKAQHGEVRPLTQDKAIALFRSVSGDRKEVLYILALMLGLRRGELLGLRWRDIDFERAQLRVAQTMVKASRLVTGTGRGAMIIGRPKTTRSARTLAFPRRQRERSSTPRAAE
jgi:integrase